MIDEALKLKLSNIELIRESAKRRFYYFVQDFWSTIIAEPPVWNWHIEKLCDRLQAVGERVARRENKEFDYLIINIPPSSSKSTIVSVMYPLWCWVIDATQQFICGSYSKFVCEDLAEKAKEILTSDLFKSCFPEIGIKSDKITKLRNSQKGKRYITSTGSGITGIHAHQIIVDDPLNPYQASSESERLSAQNWISQTLSSRKVNSKVAVTIIVMQRIHAEDPTGYILSKKGLKVEHICLPAELPPIEKNNVFPIDWRKYYCEGLFDPIRLDRETLAEKKIDLGSYGYTNQYDQREADMSGGIIKKDWFDIVDFDHYPYAKKFQLDTAYTEEEYNDPSGILSYFVLNNVIYITNWVSVRKEFPQLCEFVLQHVKANGYKENKSIVRVEPKASGKSLVQQLRFFTKLSITESNNPTKDKVARATDATAKLESRRVKLVRGPWNDTFLQEVCTFPRAPHDEAVDCLTEIVRNELSSINPLGAKKLSGFA